MAVSVLDIGTWWPYLKEWALGLVNMSSSANLSPKQVGSLSTSFLNTTSSCAQIGSSSQVTCEFKEDKIAKGKKD